MEVLAVQIQSGEWLVCLSTSNYLSDWTGQKAVTKRLLTDDLFSSAYYDLRSANPFYLMLFSVNNPPSPYCMEQWVVVNSYQHSCMALVTTLSAALKHLGTSFCFSILPPPESPNVQPLYSKSSFQMSNIHIILAADLPWQASRLWLIPCAKANLCKQIWHVIGLESQGKYCSQLTISCTVGRHVIHFSA